MVYVIDIDREHDVKDVKKVRFNDLEFIHINVESFEIREGVQIVILYDEDTDADYETEVPPQLNMRGTQATLQWLKDNNPVLDMTIQYHEDMERYLWIDKEGDK
jgi:hypothetical protein